MSFNQPTINHPPANGGTMPNFRITIDIKDVAEGDATDVAQEIWNTHAESLDASRGDFKIRVARVERVGAQFDIGWEPDQ